MVFAATTTGVRDQQLKRLSEGFAIPVYPFFARSIATCRPIPRDAPTTSATGCWKAILREFHMVSSFFHG